MNDRDTVDRISDNHIRALRMIRESLKKYAPDKQEQGVQSDAEDREKRQ